MIEFKFRDPAIQAKLAKLTGKIKCCKLIFRKQFVPDTRTRYLLGTMRKFSFFVATEMKAKTYQSQKVLSEKIISEYTDPPSFSPCNLQYQIIKVFFERGGF